MKGGRNEDKSAGDVGRCGKCGAWHYYMEYTVDGNHEHWWYAVSRSQRTMAKIVRDHDKGCVFEKVID